MNTQITDVILPDQHRRGGCVEHRVQGGAPVPQPVLRNVSYFYGESHVDSRRHLVAGGVELGQRLQPGRPQQPAADAVQLRSGSPHHDVRRLQHPDARRLHGAASRSSTAASPDVRGRRTSPATSTATCATTNDLLYIPAATDTSSTRTARTRICSRTSTPSSAWRSTSGRIHERNAAARRGSTPST